MNQYRCAMRPSRRPNTWLVARIAVASAALLACSKPANGSAASDEIAVTAVGVIDATGSSALLCPLPGGPGCPGLQLDDARGLASGRGALRVKGRLRNDRLTVESVSAADNESRAAPVCEAGTATVSAPQDLARAASAHPTYAGRWWDDQAGALTFAFAPSAGDGAGVALAQEMGALSTTTVCVVLVQFSLDDLTTALTAATARLPQWAASGYVFGGLGPDVKTNRVVVRVAAIDEALRAAVAGELGSRISFDAFLDVGSRPVAVLPLASTEAAATSAGEPDALRRSLAYHCGLTQSDGSPLTN